MEHSKDLRHLVDHRPSRDTQPPAPLPSFFEVAKRLASKVFLMTMQRIGAEVEVLHPETGSR